MTAKKYDYFVARALVNITGIVFGSQMIVEMLAARKQGYEWVIYACAGAFVSALLYAATLVVLNASIATNGVAKHQKTPIEE